MNNKEMLNVNRRDYERLYAKEEGFLRYPADWVARFYNMFLKGNIRKNAVMLDYGCGSGNNSIFLRPRLRRTCGSYRGNRIILCRIFYKT